MGDIDLVLLEPMQHNFKECVIVEFSLQSNRFVDNETHTAELNHVDCKHVMRCLWF